jgi:glucosyl-3-phosphoglycerate synthase
VEIAMLIDVLHEVGLDGLAQVDLGRRVHRNSPDDALGRMAGQVYLALLSRLERHGRALPTADLQTDLTQFTRDQGAFVPQVSSVAVDERPPAASLPHYRLQSAPVRST